MNILVTGANGQLGTCIRLASESKNDNYIFTDIAELDITDSNSVAKFISDNNVDLIINCAAYTNVDKAEDEPLIAEKINAGAVKILSEEIKKRNGWIIHVSTDYVFGGNLNNTPCSEEQQPNPTGVYGLSKLHGEEAIKESGCNGIIIRTSWLYSEYGKNFVKTMLDLTSRLPQLNVVFDQCGTPTYAQDLADSIVDIIDTRKFINKAGTYHYSNEGVTSWFDFARLIGQLAGNQAEVNPCHSNEFPSKVTRPPYSVLDKTKFKGTFEIKIPYWTDSLKKCVENLTSQTENNSKS